MMEIKFRGLKEINENLVTIQKTIICKVVADTEQAIKDCVIKYAQDRSKEMGEEISVYFVDKAVADEIITLGAQEYVRRKEGRG